MHIQIGRWGNSFAVRIPGSIAKELGLKDGSEVDIKQVNGSLILRPVQPKPPTYSLEQMLQDITPEMLHEETRWETIAVRKLPNDTSA